MELRLLTVTIGPRLLEAVVAHPAGPVRVLWPRGQDHARDVAGLLGAAERATGGHAKRQGLDVTGEGGGR
jgi:hypothetical protein